MSDQPTKPNEPPPLPNTADPTLILPQVRTTRENAGSYTKGKRKLIKGDPKYAANGKRIDAELYEAIWEAWRDGTRNKTRLSALYKLSWQSIHRLVETGYPERGFPSFLERLRVWEAAAATAKCWARSSVRSLSGGRHRPKPPSHRASGEVGASIVVECRWSFACLHQRVARFGRCC